MQGSCIDAEGEVLVVIFFNDETVGMPSVRSSCTRTGTATLTDTQGDQQ